MFAILFVGHCTYMNTLCWPAFTQSPLWEGGKEGGRKGREVVRRGKEGRKGGREGGREGRRPREGGREGGREGVREGGNIDCSMVHHVTMTYDLANTVFVNHLLQFSNNFDKISNQAVKSF